jgi:hypothetical protein
LERLTFEGNFCDIAQCRELPCKYDGSCTQKEVWERLKAYEDSRLSPQACAEAREIEETLSGCGCSISRMVELMKADKDGRVLILPCKLGTKVYRIRYKIVDYPGKPEPEITTTWFTPEYREDIGRTVFFTREEAEKALQEMEDKA